MNYFALRKGRTRHSFQSTLELAFNGSDICGKSEILSEVEYTFLPGSPATGPTYDSGGTPADPPEVEILCVNLTRKKPDGSTEILTCPEWLSELIEAQAYEADELVELAQGDRSNGLS